MKNQHFVEQMTIDGAVTQLPVTKKKSDNDREKITTRSRVRDFAAPDRKEGLDFLGHVENAIGLRRLRNSRGTQQVDAEGHHLYGVTPKSFKGAVNINHLVDETGSPLNDDLANKIRSFLIEAAEVGSDSAARVFEVYHNEPRFHKGRTAFAQRMQKLRFDRKTNTDPLEILKAFLAQYNQMDFTDYTRGDFSSRKASKKAKAESQRREAGVKARNFRNKSADPADEEDYGGRYGQSEDESARRKTRPQFAMTDDLDELEQAQIARAQARNAV